MSKEQAKPIGSYIDLRGHTKLTSTILSIYRMRVVIELMHDWAVVMWIIVVRFLDEELGIRKLPLYIALHGKSQQLWKISIGLACNLKGIWQDNSKWPLMRQKTRIFWKSAFHSLKFQTSTTNHFNHSQY